MLLNDKWELKLPQRRVKQWQEGWEVERTNVLYDLIAKDSVVFDVGAEEGDISALMEIWGAKVFPIEPSPYYWPRIKEVYDLNKIPHPLDYFVGFASDKTTNNIKPDYDPTNENGWPVCAYKKDREGFRHLAQEHDVTPQITLDDFLMRHGYRPDVLNIDVEGSEYNVLKGASKILEASKPKVVVSIHPDIMKKWYNKTVHDIHELMESFGYKRSLIDITHEENWLYL